MDDRCSTMQAPLMAVALLALLLIGYVSGFYLLGRIGTVGPVRFHIVPSQWLSVLFTPAAQAWRAMREDRLNRGHLGHF